MHAIADPAHVYRDLLWPFGDELTTQPSGASEPFRTWNAGTGTLTLTIDWGDPAQDSPSNTEQYTLPVNPTGNPCGCGNQGCLEKHASATAVTAMARMASSTTGRVVAGAALEYSLGRRLAFGIPHPRRCTLYGREDMRLAKSALVNPFPDDSYQARLLPYEEDVRGPYFRDQTAIIHSMPFRGPLRSRFQYDQFEEIL